MMRGDERGLTLVEVLVVSAALVFVLAGAYAFSSFGQRLYRSGSGQAELHAALRLAAERITRELRFAGEVSLLEEGWDPGTASLETWSYIYYDDDSKSLKLLDASGTKALSAEVISGITFSADPAGGPILLFTIHGESSTADYSLESSVQPLNVGESGIGGAAASEALSFRMPAP